MMISRLRPFRYRNKLLKSQRNRPFHRMLRKPRYWGRNLVGQRSDRMLMKSLYPIAVLAALAPLTAASAESFGFNLVYRVPVVCKVDYRADGGGMAGGAIALGALHEFCNAPNGYDLVVNYTAGSMRGAMLIAGDSRVMLDGSGQATINRSPGPRIRDVQLAAMPGSNGFDTDRLQFQLIPN